MKEQKISQDTGMEEQNKENKNISRRGFFKLGLGSAAGAMSAAVTAGFTAEDVMAKTYDDFPVPLSKDFKPFHQKNLVLTRAFGGLDEKLAKIAPLFEHTPAKDEIGYTQLDRALQMGGWEISNYAAPFQQGGQPSSGIFGWERHSHHKAENKYRFESKEAASTAIKKAAKTYGATLVGITRRDPRWDYAGFYDMATKREFGWEEFPFKPKSVIVIALEMDYENISCSPFWTAQGTVGSGYSDMVKVASCVASFLRHLGYRAIPAGNNIGNSVAYGFMAGLGEPGRNGSLVVPKLGPRVRLCKVYTDFDFLEYDKPMTFGVASFCSRCKRCADACPSKAITFDDDPSMEPTYTNSPKETWNNHEGILKYHNDSKKCFEFWCSNGGECANCITACPYNKPDFWHHRLVDLMNVVSPGPVHSVMREMDIIFGYGNTYDKDAVRKFWSKS